MARLRRATSSVATPKATRWGLSGSISAPGFSAAWVRGSPPLAFVDSGLENCRIVAVPGENRGSAAIRFPRLGDLTKLLFARPLGKPHQSPQLDHDGEVAGRKNVVATFREQQVDFRRPAANALDPGEERNCFFIINREVVEIQLTRDHQLREASDIAGFLARHSCGA